MSHSGHQSGFPFGSACVVLVHTDPLWKKTIKIDGHKTTHIFSFHSLTVSAASFTPSLSSGQKYSLSIPPVVTVESLPGSHPFRGDPDPHGPPDISCLLATVGQVGVELLCGATDHRLQGQHTLS